MNENTRRIINVNLEWKVILNMPRTFFIVYRIRYYNPIYIYIYIYNSLSTCFKIISLHYEIIISFMTILKLAT